jgi:hypothetical protein
MDDTRPFFIETNSDSGLLGGAMVAGAIGLVPRGLGSPYGRPCRARHGKTKRLCRLSPSPANLAPLCWPRARALECPLLGREGRGFLGLLDALDCVVKWLGAAADCQCRDDHVPLLREVGHARRVHEVET